MEKSTVVFYLILYSGLLGNYNPISGAKSTHTLDEKQLILHPSRQSLMPTKSEQLESVPVSTPPEWTESDVPKVSSQTNLQKMPTKSEQLESVSVSTPSQWTESDVPEVSSQTNLQKMPTKSEQLESVPVSTPPQWTESNVPEVSSQTNLQKMPTKSEKLESVPVSTSPHWTETNVPEVSSQTNLQKMPTKSEQLESVSVSTPSQWTESNVPEVSSQTNLQKMPTKSEQLESVSVSTPSQWTESNVPEVSSQTNLQKMPTKSEKLESVSVSTPPQWTETNVPEVSSQTNLQKIPTKSEQLESVPVSTPPQWTESDVAEVSSQTNPQKIPTKSEQLESVPVSTPPQWTESDVPEVSSQTNLRKMPTKSEQLESVPVSTPPQWTESDVPEVSSQTNLQKMPTKSEKLESVPVSTSPHWTETNVPEVLSQISLQKTTKVSRKIELDLEFTVPDDRKVTIQGLIPSDTTAINVASTASEPGRFRQSSIEDELLINPPINSFTGFSSSCEFDADQRICGCTPVCIQLNNCCYDSPFVDSSNETVDGHSSCYMDFNDKWVFSKPSYMVDTCAETWSEASTRQRCENQNAEDVASYIPCYSQKSGLNYKNEFCLKCNNLDDCSLWNVTFQSKRNIALSDINSFETMNDYAGKRGLFLFMLSYTEDMEPSHCTPGIVDKCKSEFRTDVLAEMCRAYYSPVIIKRVFYRNEHCFRCVTGRIEAQVEDSTPRSFKYALSALLDLKQITNNQERKPCSGSLCTNPLIKRIRGYTQHAPLHLLVETNGDTELDWTTKVDLNNIWQGILNKNIKSVLGKYSVKFVYQNLDMITPGQLSPFDLWVIVEDEISIEDIFSLQSTILSASFELSINGTELNTNGTIHVSCCFERNGEIPTTSGTEYPTTTPMTSEMNPPVNAGTSLAPNLALIVGTYPYPAIAFLFLILLSLI